MLRVYFMIHVVIRLAGFVQFRKNSGNKVNSRFLIIIEAIQPLTCLIILNLSPLCLWVWQPELNQCSSKQTEACLVFFSPVLSLRKFLQSWFLLCIHQDDLNLNLEKPFTTFHSKWPCFVQMSSVWRSAAPQWKHTQTHTSSKPLQASCTVC